MTKNEYGSLDSCSEGGCRLISGIIETTLSILFFYFVRKSSTIMRKMISFYSRWLLRSEMVNFSGRENLSMFEKVTI